MKLNADLIDELSVLSQFSLDSTLEGIKVHGDAAQSVIEATQRFV